MEYQKIELPRHRQSNMVAPPETLTESVTSQLMDDIVHGKLAPGSKLRIDELKKTYGMGASPLREALTRMLTLGFVTNETRRGFRVSSMSHEDIEEITEVRKLFELRALELSMQKGGKLWEERIVMQMARLRHEVKRSDPSREFLDPGADGIHEDYHKALIASCGLPRLIGLQETYYDLAKRYRMLTFMNIATPSHFLERHEVLTEVVLSRNVSAACTALGEHLDLLVIDLPQSLAGDGPTPGGSE